MKPLNTILISLFLTACMDSKEEVIDYPIKNSEFIGAWFVSPDQLAYFNAQVMTIVSSDQVIVADADFYRNDLTMTGARYDRQIAWHGVSKLTWSEDYQETYSVESSTLNTRVNTRYQQGNHFATYTGEVLLKPSYIVFQGMSYDLDSNFSISLDDRCTLLVAATFSNETDTDLDRFGININAQGCDGLNESYYIGEILKFNDGASKIVAIGNRKQSGVMIDIDGIDFDVTKS